MCSAWATIRPRWSKSAVEQSRRSLMFAENAERTSTAPISSAIERSDGADHLELDPHFTESARSRDSLVSRSVLLVPSLTPTHPGGTQHVAPSSSRTPGPVASSGSPLGSSSARARAHVGGAHGDELDRPVAVGVAVARLVGAVERLGEIVAAAAPPARTTGRGSAARPRPRPAARPPPRAGRRTSAPSRAARRATRGRAPRGRPPPPGTSTVSHPELLGQRAGVQRPRRRRRRRARARADRGRARPRRAAARAASRR